MARLNIRILLDRLMRNPLLQDSTLEQIVDYTIDFMRIVGVPSMFTEKVTDVEIKDYRGCLPPDFYEINQARLKRDGRTLRYASDSFHMRGTPNEKEDLTYKIQNDVIFTSFQEDTLELSYQAIDVDEDGYPMIPDNSTFLRALEGYIKKQVYTILFEVGRLPIQVLQHAEQEYAFAVGACSTDMIKLNLDKMESFSNSWKNLIIKDRAHDSGFKYDGMKERINVH